MNNALNNWATENKEYIADNTQKENPNAGLKCAKLKSGETMLTLEDIKKVTKSDFTFTNQDGTKNVVTRFFYSFVEYEEGKEETYPFLIPKSVHLDIVDLMAEYGDKMFAVKIKKSGSGKETEYKVFPQL